jgi:hypothetical protein
VLAAAVVVGFEWYRPGTMWGVQKDVAGTRNRDDFVSIQDDKLQFLYVRSGHYAETISHMIKRELKLPKSQMTVIEDATFDSLRKELLQRKFDIVHFDAGVEGDRLVLSANELVSAEALANLLWHTEAKLVVLASCNSFQLGSSLPVDAVLAAKGYLMAPSYEAWTQCFYKLLKTGIPLTRILSTLRAVFDPYGHGEVVFSLSYKRDFQLIKKRRLQRLGKQKIATDPI